MPVLVGFISIAGSPLDEGVDLAPRAYSSAEESAGRREKGEPEKRRQNYDNRIPGVSIHYKDAVELVTKRGSSGYACP